MFCIQGSCPICQTDEVGFFRCGDGVTLIVRCYECDSVWKDPVDLSPTAALFPSSPTFEVPGLGCPLVGPRAAWAAREEIEARGWASFISREYLPPPFNLPHEREKYRRALAELDKLFSQQGDRVWAARLGRWLDELSKADVDWSQHAQRTRQHLGEIKSSSNCCRIVEPYEGRAFDLIATSETKPRILTLVSRLLDAANDVVDKVPTTKPDPS